MEIGFISPIVPYPLLVEFLNILADERRKWAAIKPVKIEKVIYEHGEGLIDYQDLFWPLLNYGFCRNIFLH